MKRATALLALALALVACRNDAPTSTDLGDNETTEAAPEAPAKPAEPPPIPAPPDVAAPPPDAQRTSSGLVTKLIEGGQSTERPHAFDVVKVHYTGWSSDGTMFDSTQQRRQPAEFPLDQVIPGWTEGIQLMTVGESRRFWIPEALAYRGQAGAPKGTLVFDVELLGIQRMRPPPSVPSDLAAPPRTAKKTASGLASVVLTRGKGQDHPEPTDRVTVHYSGWTSDGKMFDSSVLRGSPATFPLNRVIAGWTEGLQLMVVGEKRRFWIPAALAYKGRAGPVGPLVFDVELLGFTKSVAPATGELAPPTEGSEAEGEELMSGDAPAF